MKYWVAASLLALTVSAILPGSAAQAAGKSYGWCALLDEQNGTAYYSAVFQGDPAKKADYQRQFQAKAEAEGDDVMGTASCSFTPDKAKAQAEHDKNKTVARKTLDYIVDLTWKP